MQLTRTLLTALVLAPFTLLHAADSRPNMVFIISDDQGDGDYGFMGHPQVQTPHLDRLAAQSLAFPRGFVPTSVCCPSLATIMTGRHPARVKIPDCIPNNDNTGELLPTDEMLAFFEATKPY